MKTTTYQNETFDGRASTELAIGCFIISTILCLLCIAANDCSYLIIICALFGAGALLVNAIMFFHLVENFIKLANERHYIGSKIAILLSNIPIAILYYHIIIKQ